MAQTFNAVRALFVLGLIIYAFFAFGLPVLGNFISFKQRVDAHFEADEETVQFFRDKYAPKVCPRYLNASTWHQWTSYRSISWCEDYDGR